MQLLHRVPLGRVGPRLFVGDELGVAGEDGVDDAQTGGLECTAGFGDVDDAVGDVGNLGFTRTVGQPHVGLDALLREEALGHLGVFAGDTNAVGQVFNALCGRITVDGHDDAHGVGGGLRVLQFAKAVHRAVGFFHPVAAGDAEIEETLGDVDGDFLGAENAHLDDAGVVDAGAVVDRRRAYDGEVGRFEEFEGGFFQ